MFLDKALLLAGTAIGLTISTAATAAPARQTGDAVELAYLDSPWRQCRRNHSLWKCLARAARGELGSSNDVFVPPPAPPTPACPLPPPAPCTVEPAFVFFDWGTDQVMASAQRLLDNFADRYRGCGGPVTVAGHTDRSEPVADNMGLSRRRAQNVARYLEGRGIPREVLTIRAYGESRPLVPTRDGVREPQNRRVEIVTGPESGW